MKSFKVPLSIVAFLIVLAAAVFIMLEPSPERASPKNETVEIIPLEEYTGELPPEVANLVPHDLPPDLEIYEEAIKTNDIAKCDEIETPEFREACKSVLQGV